MSLLTDTKILEHMEYGSVVIHPFRPDRLNTDSYDLELGPWFWRYRHNNAAAFDPRHDDRHELFELEDARRQGGIWLQPGERVLGHSVDIAGGRVGRKRNPNYNEVMNDIAELGGMNTADEYVPVAVTTHLQATSTAARYGITACMCAGWGDVGFVNMWTLEIENRGVNRLFLPIGSIIAQVCFTEVYPPNDIYGKGNRGQYMYADPDEEAGAIREAWEPEHMIPGQLKVRETWRELFGGPNIVNENVTCTECGTGFITSSDHIGRCPVCGGPGRTVS